MDEREESQVEERSEVITEEGTERREDEIEEGSAIGEAVAEEERCEEDPECHSSAKRARVCATFTDSEEVSIVEFVKLHPELYDKEHSRFHDRNRREALWAEISAELKLQPFDARRWFESQRTPYGKLSKLQSGQALREMTKRQSWVYQQVFLKPTSEERGPTEVHVLRPVQIPAGRMNHVGQLLTQNTSSPVSGGRGVSPSLHQHPFQLQTPRFSNTLSR